MADRIGQQLGNYRLTRLLGEGGFAAVYLGEHIHLNTLAAIKVLRAQLASDDVEQFRTEARTIAHLIHPLIVRVLDFDLEDKTPFLVMDYAPNGTLRQRHPKDSQLPLSTVVSYIKQIADALQYAHEEKLIHRDIKPENMLLGRRNEILLSDFGIAIVAQSSRYQNTQEMAGTIAYMAPEQIQAHPRPASDQYSLGIVVYEWLSGKRPFHGSMTEIAIQHSIVPPPSLQEQVSTISPVIEQVVFKALAKDPHQRFESVLEFATALEQASQPKWSVAVTPPEHQPPSLPSPAVVSSKQVTISPSLGTLLDKIKPNGSVRSLAWSPNGKCLAFSTYPEVSIWDTATKNIISVFQDHSSSVYALAWSPDSKYVASSGYDEKVVKVWEVSSATKILTYRGHFRWKLAKGTIYSIAWSPDGMSIASGGGDNRVHIWDNISGHTNLIYKGHSWSVNAVAWSPDGTYIASSSLDEIHVWDGISGIKVVAFGCPGFVRAVVWSPDGKRIASASKDSVDVWNVAKKKHKFSFHGHGDKDVTAIAWSPNGKLIASASEDATVRLWNASDGSDVYTYRGHSTKVNAIAWSPDGKYIASGSEDKKVRIWRTV